MGKKSGVLTGTLIGLGLGALAGILYAPKKGSETRADIKKKAEQYEKDAKQTYRNLEKQVERSGKSAMKTAQQQITNKIEQTVKPTQKPTPPASSRTPVQVPKKFKGV